MLKKYNNLKFSFSKKIKIKIRIEKKDIIIKKIKTISLIKFSFL